MRRRRWLWCRPESSGWDRGTAKATITSARATRLRSVKPLAVGKYPVTFDEWKTRRLRVRREEVSQHKKPGTIEVGRAAKDGTACYQRLVGRCESVHKVAVRTRPSLALPALERGGMGVCPPGGKQRRPYSFGDNESESGPSMRGICPTRAAQLIRWARKRPTVSACTTCTAMSGSGARIPGTAITMVRRMTVRLGQPEVAEIVSFAAARGTTIRSISARPTATSASLRSGTALGVSAWPWVGRT